MSVNNQNLCLLYIPNCNKCNSILKIKFQPLNFSIDYECINDKNHNENKIYYKTFERFYFKKKELKICSVCKLNLENSEYSFCKNCKKNYCLKCYIEDIKKNGHTSNDIINNRCLIHNNDFTEYCVNCKKNICMICGKDEEHNGHEIKSYYEIIPSYENIERIKKKIKEKKEYTNNLIKKIDNWKKEINKKTEELKQNLIDEISLLEKIIFSFNNNYRNYIYFQNYNYIFNYLKNTNNNKYLVELNNTFELEKQTRILMNIFKYMGRNIDIIENVKGNLKKINYLNCIYFDKINEKYFINYDSSKNLKISNYDKNTNCLYFYQNISLNEEIYSISHSKIENKILICLLRTKKVLIIDYNLDKKLFELSDESIYKAPDNNLIEDHFYKCIQLSNKIIATSDKNYIYIWIKEESKYLQNKFIFRINNQIQTNLTLDMLLIDNNYLISTQARLQTLSIIDIQNFQIIKKIKKIDCLDSNNCLFKLNNKYIIINCFKGFGIFFIQTKELIQYVQNFELYLQKKIRYDANDNIYIINIKELWEEYNYLRNIPKEKQIGFIKEPNNTFNYKNNYNNQKFEIKIKVGKIIDGEFRIVKEYEKLYIDENIIEFMHLDNYFLLFGINAYIIMDNNEN